MAFSVMRKCYCINEKKQEMKFIYDSNFAKIKPDMQMRENIY